MMTGPSRGPARMALTLYAKGETYSERGCPE